jgi:hypothetical protein
VTASQTANGMTKDEEKSKNILFHFLFRWPILGKQGNISTFSLITIELLSDFYGPHNSFISKSNIRSFLFPLVLYTRYNP